MSDRIPGGYVLKPRKIKNSDISDASPCTRETWDYLIREANHKPFKRGKFKLDRGQLFRSYDEILDDLCWYVGWRKERYTKNQMKQAMKFLRDTERITTSKKPGGVLITICNYSTYQDPSNYERTNEETKETTIEKPLRNQEETSHNYKNDNNGKNVKNDNRPPTREEVEEYFQKRGDMILDDIPREAENFINHYEEREWKTSSGNKIKSWKRQAATWNNNYMRFNEDRLENRENQNGTVNLEIPGMI